MTIQQGGKVSKNMKAMQENSVGHMGQQVNKSCQTFDICIGHTDKIDTFQELCSIYPAYDFPNASTDSTVHV